MQQRRTYLAHLRDRATSDAVTRERLRIARELHDVVAHSMTVVTVQAGFGEYVFDSQPAEARAALGAIQAVSREALGEMQRLLCVLRQPEADPAPGDPAQPAGPGPAAGPGGDTGRRHGWGGGRGRGGRARASPDPRPRPAVPLAPAPGLASLDRLVQRTAGAGVTVAVQCTGAIRPLPAGLDLSAFRIVQEALTNVVKHSGADRCQVRLDYGPADLLIEVTDHGAAAPATVGAATGAAGTGMNGSPTGTGFAVPGFPGTGLRQAPGWPALGSPAPGWPRHWAGRHRAGQHRVGQHGAASRARHRRHAGTGQPVRRRVQRRAASRWRLRGPGQVAARFPFMTLRVLVADDQALVRAGFRGIVAATPGFEVVGEAGTGAEAVELARRHIPDVVLMDVRMPEMDGIEATRQITRTAATSGVRVLILTTFDLDEYVYSALRAGASGFLLKSISPAELLTAIQVIAAGDALLAPSVTRRLVEEFARSRPGRAGRPAPGGHARRDHRPGAGGARPGGQRPVQQRDRPPPGHQPGHHQDTRRAPAHQAQRARPRPPGHPGLPGGPGRAHPMTAGERAGAPGERRIQPGLSPGLTPVLVGLFVVGVLVGLRGGFAAPGLHGPLRHDGIGVGIALEAVLAVLLSALLIRQRRQPAADFATRRLRTVLRAVLLAGLVAIPVVLVADRPLRGPRPPRTVTGPPRPAAPSARPTHLTRSASIHLPLTALLYTLLGILLLAAIVACVLLLRRRPAGHDALPPEDASLAEGERTELRAAVRSGQRALAGLDDARAAIIACYLAMERSLAAAGADRTDADTPAEFLDRAAAAAWSARPRPAS